MFHHKKKDESHDSVLVATRNVGSTDKTTPSSDNQANASSNETATEDSAKHDGGLFSGIRRPIELIQGEQASHGGPYKGKRQI